MVVGKAVAYRTGQAGRMAVSTLVPVLVPERWCTAPE